MRKKEMEKRIERLERQVGCDHKWQYSDYGVWVPGRSGNVLDFKVFFKCAHCGAVRTKMARHLTSTQKKALKDLGVEV